MANRSTGQWSLLLEKSPAGHEGIEASLGIGRDTNLNACGRILLRGKLSRQANSVRCHMRRSGIRGIWQQRWDQGYVIIWKLRKGRGVHSIFLLNLIPYSSWSWKAVTVWSRSFTCLFCFHDFLCTKIFVTKSGRLWRLTGHELHHAAEIS